MTDQRDINRFIDTYRNLAKPAKRQAVACYAIEGLRMVKRALEAGATIQSVLTTPPDPTTKPPSGTNDSQAQLATLIDRLTQSGCDVLTAEKPILEELVQGRERGLIAALVKIPTPLQFNDPTTKHTPGKIFLGAVNATDPGNTGALVRTALASGAAGFIAIGETDPYHPKAVRTSQGSIFKMPILTAKTTAEACTLLQNAGIWCVGSVTQNGVPLADAKFAERLAQHSVAMFVGAEGPGLTPSDIEAMDQLVTIPMRPGVDSFAINAAAAVALYEVGRERNIIGEKNYR